MLDAGRSSAKAKVADAFKLTITDKAMIHVITGRVLGFVPIHPSTARISPRSSSQGLEPSGLDSSIGCRSSGDTLDRSSGAPGSTPRRMIGAFVLGITFVLGVVGLVFGSTVST